MLNAYYTSYYDNYNDLAVNGQMMIENNYMLNPMMQPLYSNNLIYEPIDPYYPPIIPKKIKKQSNDHYIDKYKEMKKDDKNDEFDEFINSRLDSDDTEDSGDELNE